MTIPVDNRPRYEVGARPAASDTPRADQASPAPIDASGPEPRIRVARLGPGCVASAILLFVLTSCCVGSILFSVMSGGLDETRARLTSDIIADLRHTADTSGAAERHRGALDQLEELSHAKRIGWLAFSVLVNRWSEARADDAITPSELEHLMSLVRDIDARGGEIDPEDYPNGR